MGICDMDIDIDIDILIYTCVCIYVHTLCFIHSIRKTKQFRTMLSDTVCVWCLSVCVGGGCWQF